MAHANISSSAGLTHSSHAHAQCHANTSSADGLTHSHSLDSVTFTDAHSVTFTHVRTQCHKYVHTDMQDRDLKGATKHVGKLGKYPKDVVTDGEETHDQAQRGETVVTMVVSGNNAAVVTNCGNLWVWGWQFGDAPVWVESLDTERNVKVQSVSLGVSTMLIKSIDASC